MKTAFIFPGQGSQKVGMGADLHRKYPVARKTFEEADEALGFSISKLMLEGPGEELAETRNTQPAILTCSVAYLRVLRQHGIDACAAAGHSVGEYAALVATGALEFGDAVRLVYKRGMYMQEAVPLGVGGMTAVLLLPADKVRELCARVSTTDAVVEPAGYNSPLQTACAGHLRALERLEALVGEEGGTCKRLKVSAPFHSSLLAPAAEALARELEKIEFKDPRFPYVANVDVSWVDSAAGIRSRLIEQVQKPVLWEQTIRILAQHDIDRYIEVGAGRTVAGLVKRIDRRMKVQCTDHPPTFASLLSGGTPSESSAAS